MRTALVTAVLGLVALGLTTLSLATHGTALAKDNPVNAGNYYFCDASQEGHVCETDVGAGDTVTWHVLQGTHQIAQCTDATFATCSGGFDSGSLQANATFQQSFATTGTFYYYCAFHPSEMRGKVVVAAATGTPTPSPIASPTAVATVTATPTAGTLPNSGGAPDDSGTDVWLYALLAVGGLLVAGSGLTFALARRR
jgi:plastocyanin